MKMNLNAFMEKEIKSGTVPGAVIFVSKNGSPVLHEAFGSSILIPKPEEMRTDTIFDLASLTKVVATLPAVLKLASDKAISLESRISDFFPGKKDSNVTVRHLLTHTSGLPAHRRYYEKQLSFHDAVEEILKEEGQYVPGTKVIYSDLGFILLAKIIERAAGTAFEKFVQQEIFSKLGMSNTIFNPESDPSCFAATDFDEKTKRYKRGKVHDENAASMGGISGHAGLFSTAEDLHTFALMIENEGMTPNGSLIDPQLIELSRRNFTSFDDESRGLGWQLNGTKTKIISCGSRFPETAYGHTGYTGTSIWFDPVHMLHVIILTNRVHAADPNKYLEVRPSLHDLIFSHMEGDE